MKDSLIIAPHTTTAVGSSDSDEGLASASSPHTQQLQWDLQIQMKDSLTHHRPTRIIAPHASSPHTQPEPAAKHRRIQDPAESCLTSSRLMRVSPLRNLGSTPVLEVQPTRVAWLGSVGLPLPDYPSVISWPPAT